jgi:hypothetical protein
MKELVGRDLEGRKEEKEKRYVISCTYSGELKDEVQS